MNFLTNDKLVIVGAGGMIGSNMVQSALMLGLTPNICLYDIFEPGVHGVFDEIQQCAFPGVNVTYTVKNLPFFSVFPLRTARLQLNLVTTSRSTAQRLST